MVLTFSPANSRENSFPSNTNNVDPGLAHFSLEWASPGGTWALSNKVFVPEGTYTLLLNANLHAGDLLFRP